MSISEEEARAIWLAGEEVGRRKEQKRITSILESLTCDKPYCKEAKIIPVHSSCRTIRNHIKLINEGRNE